jgi:hypothetical protein
MPVGEPPGPGSHEQGDLGAVPVRCGHGHGEHPQQDPFEQERADRQRIAAELANAGRDEQERELAGGWALKLPALGGEEFLSDPQPDVLRPQGGYANGRGLWAGDARQRGGAVPGNAESGAEITVGVVFRARSRWLAMPQERVDACL